MENGDSLYWHYKAVYGPLSLPYKSHADITSNIFAYVIHHLI